MRSSHYDWSEDFDEALRDWLAQAPSTPPTRRLVLIGSAPPDERLHEAVERGGGVIVGELNETELPLTPSSQSTTDPIEAAAYRAHTAIGAARALLRSREALERRMRELDAQGAIVWLIAADTGLAWEAPRLASALHAAGAPALLLTQQRWGADDAILARIAEFARTLESGT